MTTLDADIVGEAAPRPTVTATAPATPTAVPVMAIPGNEVPLATPPTIKPTWKTRGLKWSAAAWRWAVKHPAWVMTAVAWIATVLLVAQATGQLNSMARAVEEKNQTISALRAEVGRTQAAVRDKEAWAWREVAKPWWQKLGTWW